MPQFRSRSGPDFTFLVHPRDIEDVYQANVGGLLRRTSVDEADVRRKMKTVPPTVIGEIRFGFGSIWGELMCITRMPEEMVSGMAANSVAEALEAARGRGTSVFGLGALTGPATGGGVRLRHTAPSDCTITNGNALTAAVVRRNVLEAVEIAGTGPKSTVAVVGCTGSVGVAACHLLAEHDFRLLLIGRTVKRVRSLLPTLSARATMAADLGGLEEAEVVVLLTADKAARIRPEMLRPGAVVIDCAQPANVEDDQIESFRSHGVRVAEGGLVEIPGYSCEFDFRLHDRKGVFACLAETYLFAREGIREHSLGRPQAELARRLERVAERRGIRPLPLPFKLGGRLGQAEVSQAGLGAEVGK